jgi:hypothetical protein
MFMSKGNKAPVVESRNINASTAINDRGPIPELEKP